MAPKKTSRRWRWIRLSVQILVLALFLYLLIGNRVGATTFLPGDLFFHLDPLTGLSAMLAEKRFIAPMLLGLLTIGLTLVLGRVWCSWICPLGTLLDWTNLRRRYRNALGHLSQWRQVKYLVLFAVLFAALLGTLSLAILDPITILFRTVTSGVLPGLNSLYHVDRDPIVSLRFASRVPRWIRSFHPRTPAPRGRAVLHPQPGVDSRSSSAFWRSMPSGRASGAATSARSAACWDWCRACRCSAALWIRRSAIPADGVPGSAR